LITLLKKRSIIILCIALLMGANGLSILEPTLPQHLHDTFDMSTIMVGLVFMTDSIGYGIASPVVGYIGDKWHGRKPLLVLGMVAVSIALPLLSVPDQIWLQFVVAAVSGACLAILLNPILPSLAGTYSLSSPHTPLLNLPLCCFSQQRLWMRWVEVLMGKSMCVLCFFKTKTKSSP